MNGYMEYAAGPRSIGTFPDEWGLPEGRTYSPQREAWVKEQVYRHSRSPQVALRRLADSDKRLLVMLRMAELRQRARAEHW